MKFECQRCATCCSKIIPVNAGDLRRIWKELGGSPFDYVIFRNDAHVSTRRVVGDKHTGVMVLKQIDGRCMFLEGNECTIQEFKPMTCKMYPLDPLVKVGLIVGDINIKIRYAKDCPGVGIGKKYRAEMIMKRWIEERKELDNYAIGWPGNLMEFVARCVGAKISAD